MIRVSDDYGAAVVSLEYHDFVAAVVSLEYQMIVLKYLYH